MFDGKILTVLCFAFGMCGNGYCSAGAENNGAEGNRNWPTGIPVPDFSGIPSRIRDVDIYQDQVYGPDYAIQACSLIRMNAYSMKKFCKVLEEHPEMASLRMGKHGVTLLHVIADCNNMALAKLLVHRYKVDVNMRTYSDYTPLHGAVMGGHKRMVRFLIENGADVLARHSEDGDAISIANAYGHVHLISMLRRAIRRAKRERRSEEGSRSEAVANEGVNSSIDEQSCGEVDRVDIRRTDSVADADARDHSNSSDAEQDRNAPDHGGAADIAKTNDSECEGNQSVETVVAGESNVAATVESAVASGDVVVLDEIHSAVEVVAEEKGSSSKEKITVIGFEELEMLLNEESPYLAEMLGDKMETALPETDLSADEKSHHVVLDDSGLIEKEKVEDVATEKEESIV